MSTDVCVKGAHPQYVGVIAVLKVSVEYELLKRYAVLE
jgi:hydrogenase maturation factor